jgi:hypothetical protein
MVEDGSGTQFQIRNISCCSMLLGVTTYIIRFTVSNQEKNACCSCWDCFTLCQVCCFNTVEDILIHFHVMLSMRKHGKSGIIERKKSAGQGGQHHHKREKGFDKETYGVYSYAYLYTMDRSV